MDQKHLSRALSVRKYFKLNETRPRKRRRYLLPTVWKISGSGTFILLISFTVIYCPNLKKLAGPARFERAICSLEGCRLIQLGHGPKSKFVILTIKI